jgi:hypothetical protein
MFSHIRRINYNKMFNTSSIRKLSQNNNNNKDVKYDMIISELESINVNISIMMTFVLPAAGCYLGSEIGTIIALLIK